MNNLSTLIAAIEDGSIRALSILQPFPENIFVDGKDIENRSWRTDRRGWFIVHADKSTRLMQPDQYHLPRGGVVGLAQITRCVTASDSPWFFGPFGFQLANAFPIPLVPCSGKLGFFVLPQETRLHVAAHVLEHFEAQGRAFP